MSSALTETTFWLCGSGYSHSRLPNGRFRRPPGSVRSVRTLCHLLQLVSKSQLSEVSGRGPRPVADRTGSRVVAGGVFPCGVSSTAADRPPGATECQDSLQHSLPDSGRDAADHRGGPQASGGGNRLPGRASQLGSKSCRPVGLSPDGSRWIACRPKFFLPVPVLSRLFRGKLLALLRQVFAEGKLEFFGQLADLAEPARFHAWLRKSKKTEWVVYAKPPFGGPEYVLKYLARYTHRVAITSNRLLSLDDGRITFRWRDSRHGHQTKSMTLDAVEFIRRFLLHILPSGFMKIRHFGFLANRNRASALALCRQHLNASSPTVDPVAILTREQQSAVERRCPVCLAGMLRIVEWLSADQIPSRQQAMSPTIQVNSP
jgi:hypothetical protein